MTDLKREQAAILAFFFDNAPVEEVADTFDFRLVGDFSSTFYGASVRLSAKTGFVDCFLIATLATHSSRVFFAVSRARQMDVLRVLGNLEDYSRTHSVKNGDVIAIDDEAFSALGLTSAMLMRPAVLGGFDDFPDSDVILGRRLDFSLVLFMNSDEFDYLTENGHDALMSKFQLEDRSIVVFP